MILTVLKDISPSSHLILNVLFLRTQPQFLGWEFGEFAIAICHCSIYCKYNLFFWLFLWWHERTVVMSYCLFFLHKKSQHLSYLVYISSRIFQKGIIQRIQLFLSMHFIDKFINVSYLLLVDCFFLSSISVNTFITIAFFLSFFKGLTLRLRLKDAVKTHPLKAWWPGKAQKLKICKL